MISRLVAIGLLLCTLLVSNVSRAQSVVDPIPSTAVCEVSEPSFLQDVAVMWLYVVKDRQTEKLAFTSADLARMPVISVDGYVNGVVLLGTSRLNPCVNQSPMNLIRADADGLFKLKYFGYFNSDEFWSTFLPVESERKAAGQIQGRYSSFSKVPGDVLCEGPEFRITIAQHRIENHLTIRQNTRIKLGAGHLPATGADVPEFYYLGTDVRRFADAADAFEQRMHAIFEGIHAVENAVAVKSVRRVHLIDFDGPHNAYTCTGENQIWLYSQTFWDESVDELRTIAEHETMHIISDRLGLPISSRMRELFADLMGFGAISRQRFHVLATGQPPAGKPASAAGPKPSMLFDFINEINFIRGMNGGHAQDDLDEFCASFLHTLIYIDRLENLLSQPVKSRDGSFITLSSDQQAKLISDYQTVLAAMVEESRGQLPAPLANLFKVCLDSANKVGMTFKARRAVSDRQAQPS
jgi:hypothetical protein